MFLLMFAAIGGGLATASILSPFGGVVAALSAPLGGSLCAVLAAIHLTRRSTHESDANWDIDTQTDAMVASLRDLAAQSAKPELEAGPEAAEEPKRAHRA
ncbi:MAG: hypothetical protein K2Y56_00550 [Methylobacterium sp.]|uniref:hypothetical protein n=1 Tax=Methylobacterium sp. TaxID=409 RepID=UPI0025EF533C|nr:hypothetical protein [Methylobacterium sp.]MBX9930028.1 hypothetical protein [Methylobacterium sp.]